MLHGYLKMEPKSNSTSFICFQEYLKDWYAGKDSIEKVQEYSKSQPNAEAVGGWCEVDCGNNLKILRSRVSIKMMTSRTSHLDLGTLSLGKATHGLHDPWQKNRAE